MNSYDCSIKERKGCNYCMRGKEIYEDGGIRASINDDDGNGDAKMEIDHFDGTSSFKIFYCPICGRKLGGKDK